ncbi:LysR family transcriptional regulator [Paraburkholderia tropica]|uniref:LysR family transcriptional regulator n=1 Tax=Paraburkholderia tropica TaxID=92647 RepID=UPI0039DF39B5
MFLITNRDIRRLDLNLLRVLSALIEERSVTRAAARLGLTQPAVSGILLRLRESFDDMLLVRAQRGMVPTSRALALAPSLRRLLSDVEELLQPPSFDPISAELTLSIAASDYALSVLLKPFLATLREQAPRMRTIVRPFVRETVINQLEMGSVDIALMAARPQAELHFEELVSERFVCAMRDDHPAAAGPWSLDVFCSLDHALVAFDGTFEGPTDTSLAAVGRERRVAISVSSFLFLPKILGATDLVAVAPHRLVADTPGLVLREPPISIPGFAVSAAWHERSHLDPGRAWARSLLVECCRSVLPSERGEVLEQVGRPCRSR